MIKTCSILKVSSKFLSFSFIYLFIYLPECEVNNIQSRLHSETLRTDRRKYRTYVCSWT